MSSASKLGSWTVLDARYSCVFPVGDIPDPSIVKAIRVICPNYVPMWVARHYQTPAGGEHVAKYHVIGTWQPYVTDDKTLPVRAERGSDFPFHGGVVYAQRPWSLPWPDKSWQAQVNFPEQGRPFDWGILWFVRQAYYEARVPFGTFLMGDIHAAGRQINRNREVAADLERKELEKVQEDARLHLRDDARQVYRAFNEAKDAYESGRLEQALLKEVDAKPFRDQIKTEAAAPEPPAAG